MITRRCKKILLDSLDVLCYSGEYKFKKIEEEGGEYVMRENPERGQGLVEYALILVMIAVVVLAVLLLLGPVIGNMFSNVNSELQDVSYILRVF